MKNLTNLLKKLDRHSVQLLRRLGLGSRRDLPVSMQYRVQLLRTLGLGVARESVPRELPPGQLLRTLVIVYVTLGFGVPALAGNWTDDFNAPRKDPWRVDWKAQGDDAVWEVKDGFLTAEIHVPFRLGTSYGIYRFKTFPAPYHDFTITVKDIGSEQADFGITLGKRFPEVVDGYRVPFFYDFFPHRIAARRYGEGWDDTLPAGFRQPRHPKTVWKTRELRGMAVHFNQGHFQLFAEGELRADFHDPGFAPIEIIGFVIVGTENVVGTAWADAFTIAGPAMDVSAKTKLTTTWGSLKTGK